MFVLCWHQRLHYLFNWYPFDVSSGCFLKQKSCPTFLSSHCLHKGVLRQSRRLKVWRERGLLLNTRKGLLPKQEASYLRRHYHRKRELKYIVQFDAWNASLGFLLLTSLGCNITQRRVTFVAQLIALLNLVCHWLQATNQSFCVKRFLPDTIFATLF